MKKKAFAMLKETAQEWSADKSPRLAAALAYYTLFSIAPLLLIAISVAGLVFGEEAARGEIVGTVQSVIGENAARVIQEMIANANNENAGIIGTIIGIVTLLFGASGVFGQLKDALNTVWSIEPQKSGVIGLIKQRFLSFAMVLGTGFLLLVSLVLSAVLSALGKYMEGRIPGDEAVWQVVHFVVAVGVITVLFALIFRYLPDRKVPWRDVWIGALFTAVLFAIGKFGIALYLGKSSTGSAFGAAGSLVVLLLWVYYSGLILLFGAEFTEVYSRRESPESVRSRPHDSRVDAKPSLGRRPVARLQPPLVAREAVRKRGGKGGAVAAGVGGAAVGTIAGGVGAVVIVFKLLKRLVTFR